MFGIFKYFSIYSIIANVFKFLNKILLTNFLLKSITCYSEKDNLFPTDRFKFVAQGQHLKNSRHFITNILLSPFKLDAQTNKALSRVVLLYCEITCKNLTKTEMKTILPDLSHGSRSENFLQVSWRESEHCPDSPHCFQKVVLF